ncbi:MAG: hypothetical protein JSV37_11230 [Anaerolineaceae bacterium]|nr:MAG: hypothetical protein JSV37_11230 [Anaerolineaceae bacterium]
MDKKALIILALLLLSGIIAACGPSQDELDAQATEIAANIFATQTAEAPTSTPTSSPTSTPTSTHTLTPTYTQTPTPTLTPFPSFRDDFAKVLAPGWIWMNEDMFTWNTSEKPGFLRIYLSDKGLVDGAENTLLRNAPEGDFEITTRVLFTPYSNYQFAGLLVYQDTGHFLQFGRAMCYVPDIPGRCVGNGLYFDQIDIDMGGELGFVGDNFSTRTAKESEAYLRIVREGRTYTAFYSEDGINWQPIGRHESDLFPFYVGLIASQAYGYPAIADFDYFTLETLP